MNRRRVMRGLLRAALAAALSVAVDFLVQGDGDDRLEAASIDRLDVETR